MEKMFGEKRSKCIIILDILRALRQDKKAKKTRIMQRACLDWRNFKQYFDFLLKRNFIAKNDSDDSYSITPRGDDLLRSLKEFEALCR